MVQFFPINIKYNNTLLYVFTLPSGKPAANESLLYGIIEITKVLSTGSACSKLPEIKLTSYIFLSSDDVTILPSK